MDVIQGTGTSPGIASGPLFFYRHPVFQAGYKKVSDPEKELARYETARKAVAARYEELYEHTLKVSGEEEAQIFQIHGMMLDDDDFSGFITDMIHTQSVSAESAVFAAASHLEQMLKESGDDYITERSADVKEIVTALLETLSGKVKIQQMPDRPVILYADELSPSETVNFDHDKILGLMTLHGSGNSHSAILARSMGIPAVSGLEKAPAKSLAGKTVIVNGNNGTIYTDPDDSTTARFTAEKDNALREKKELQLLVGQPDRTLDGHEIELFANIGNQAEIRDVLENDAGGIGLFRSEFLYLGRTSYPDEEILFSAYRTAAEGMHGKKVIIRTIDIGADKKADYFGLPGEDNPAMGMRAIRICLTRPELFKTQLRAILRASVFGNLAVMFPMIISPGEIRKAKAILSEAERELAAKQTVFNEHIETGIMIETPAAAIMSDILAKECDFFSIGTNDLTQYTLAIDRQNPELADFLDTHHPAVLRLIETTVRNAHREGIKAGICGELAADPELTETFVKMGVDELSVAPSAILPLRRRIRSLNISVAQIKAGS